MRRFADSKSIEEAKYFLLEKFNRYINTSNNIEQTHFTQEINQQLQNLSEDNNRLKKAILVLAKKCEVKLILMQKNKNVNKETMDLKLEYQNLKRILQEQRQNNILIEELLK